MRLGVLAAVLFVDAALFGALIPLLPALRDAHHLDKGAAGLLFAAFGAGAMVAGVPAGLTVQRVGPRRTVVGGLVLMATASLAFALAGDALTLGCARLLQGVGSVTAWSGGLAWIAVTAPADRRGRSLGTAFGVAVFGTILGPAVGALARETSVRAVFLAVCAVACALMVAVARMPEPPSEPRRAGGVRRAVRDRRFLAGLWLNVLPAVFFGAVSVLATLRLDAGGFGAAAVAAVFVVAGAAEAIMNPMVGRLVDRTGRLGPVRWALGASAVVAVALSVAARPWPVAVLVLLGTLAFGALYTPGMAVTADRADAAGLGQGLAFGLSNTVWAAGAAVGPAAGAMLAQHTSDAVPYLVAAALSAVTLLALRRP